MTIPEPLEVPYTPEDADVLPITGRHSRASLQAAIQRHHDTRYLKLEGPGNRSVVNPIDLALYEAAGIKHSRLRDRQGGCPVTLVHLREVDEAKRVRRALLKLMDEG